MNIGPTTTLQPFRRRPISYLCTRNGPFQALRPVTPEVAGSSPVAPAQSKALTSRKLVLNRHARGEQRRHRDGGYTSSGATVGVAIGGAPPGGAIQSSMAGSSRYPPTPASVRAPSSFLVFIV
jgi:hypothetical protein